MSRIRRSMMMIYGINRDESDVDYLRGYRLVYNTVKFGSW